MGVPKFFRYISERYPCLSEVIKEHQIPEFDYLYLDMNGIIHTCSHPNDNDVCFRISEETIFKNIFHYVEVLFNMIRPQKLFFMAIDGVAPRAKINQQRGRRFRSAKDAEVQEMKARAKGIEIPKERRFDSNCITPGTSFMAKLNEQLKRFVEHKISTNDAWKKCKVLFSGSEVPGEGEHKIMDYIRYMKVSEDYDSRSRHCLYGLDADLIMLGLCSHEPNFSLLREEVKFGKQQVKMTPEETKFCLLHLSLLREYLEHEFSPLKDELPFPFDIEKIIDDWVLMGFLVGNDFIPHLPNLHIANGALPILYHAYMEVLPTLEGYINEAGTLKLDRFEKFMEKLSRLDIEQFNEHYIDLKYFESKTGRRPNESERYVYKKLEDDEVASPKKTQNKDLDALIEMTEMSLGLSDEDDDDIMGTIDMMDDESDSDIYNTEFVQHKKDYYMNKLEYENVDEEVLRSQAEGYVRAIQWNLHYYYHGCCSWSWYYPHHYAPYISDIRDFKDLKLEFDLGEPFLPFQQLLAVLPAHSKELLPQAFQLLLTQESSPIISYYPHEFKTDLNGKRQEWEAVVLIPFIDEKLLLAAMEPHLSKLSAEEQARNKHGPMYLYSYTNEIRSIHKETNYFPGFISHAQLTLFNRDDIFVPRERLVRGLAPDFDLQVYYPGFPLLRHLPHKTSLQKAKVKVFQQASLGENMILEIISEETPSVPLLAEELLGRSVYVEWPHLKEALVCAVASSKLKFSLIDPLSDYSHDNVKKENVKNAALDEWNVQKKLVKETHMSRLGIAIGDTEVLVYARLFNGYKYCFGSQGKVSVEKQWQDIPMFYAYQTIVRNLSVYSKQAQIYKSIHDIFEPGTICFMLGHPYYGAMGEVMQNDDPKSRRIKISMKIIKEPTFEGVKKVYSQQKTRYMYGNIAAQRLGISSHLLSRITGTIYVIQAVQEEISKYNIGLNLKFNKKNEEVPGYTKKETNQWLYSIKAVELIRNYMTQCPDLFERLAQNVTNDIFQEQELFKESDELMNTVAWLKTALHGLEGRACGMDIVEPELMKDIEKEIEEYLKTEEGTKTVLHIQVKPHLLFKPELNTRHVPPDPYVQNRLFDRIRSIRIGFSVPLGAKATIVGIRKSKNPMDVMYEVLFDKPFMGGLILQGCSSSRGYRLTCADFVNISFGERTERGNPANESAESRKQAANANAPVSPSKKSDQSKAILEMQLAKRELEKLSRDIRLAQQHGVMETNPKIVPHKALPQKALAHKPQRAPPYNNEVPGNNEVSCQEFQELWNDLHKQVVVQYKKPDKSPAKVASNPMMTPNKQQPMNMIGNSRNNSTVQSPQDPSAFLKAMLKIPDVTAQSSKQQSSKQCISQPPVHQEAVTRRDQDAPPLVQQMFDHARRRTEEKKEKGNPIWYSSQLMRHFSYNGGMPKYNYIADEKTGLISAQVILDNARVVKGDPCTSHEQAAENAAKRAYKVLNLDKAQGAKMMMVPRPQWYNNQQNNWVQNMRPPMILMCPPKVAPMPQNPSNLFYPKWNQKLPPANPAFVQSAIYSQGRQQQARQKNPQNEPKAEVRNTTAFVPLQAQKKSRHASAKQASSEANVNLAKKIIISPKAQQQQQQQQQKREETPLKNEKPSIVNTVREKTSGASSQQQASPQPQQNAGRASRPRKSRVAAKFGTPALSNGSETPQ